MVHFCSSRILFLILGMGLGFPATSQVAGKERHIEIILDASGSMGEMVDKELKINTAKRMLHMAITSMEQEKAHTSLTVFGHRKDWSCKDIERVLDFSPKTAEKLAAVLEPIVPARRGKTPIARSLDLAAKRLKGIKGPKGVFVITDGLETCGGDPCKAAEKLRKDLDVQLYVLSYGAKTLADFKPLSCIGPVAKADTAEGFAGALADLKAQFDERSMADQQLLRILGPKRDAWAVARSKSDPNLVIRFLAHMGTSIPVGVYNVEVLYEPKIDFKDVEIKTKEKKMLKVEGEGSIKFPMDLPGLEFKAVDILSSKTVTFTSATSDKVPVGRYNISALTPSGLAFQWINQAVTPGLELQLEMPNWGILEIQSKEAATFELLGSTLNSGSSVPKAKKTSTYRQSVGFFVANAPHIVEVGEYAAVFANGGRIEEIKVQKGATTKKSR